MKDLIIYNIKTGDIFFSQEYYMQEKPEVEAMLYDIPEGKRLKDITIEDGEPVVNLEDKPKSIAEKLQELQSQIDNLVEMEEEVQTE